MAKSDIEWTEMTWNPTHGCKAISPGCANCYAEPMTARLEAMGQASYAGLTKPGVKGGRKLRVWTGEFREVPEALDIPLRRRKPTTYFVNSMSDLFGEGVDNRFIAAVFGVMNAPPHTFQVLTKRAERMRMWMDWIYRVGGEFGPPDYEVCQIESHNYGADVDRVTRSWPPPNVWLGVSVEDRKHGLPRIEHLRRTPAALRFLSIEPLLEDLGEIDLTGIDWVIVGGESGNGARVLDMAWVRRIVAQCREQGVAPFVKQGGALWFDRSTAKGVRGACVVPADAPWTWIDPRTNGKGGDIEKLPADLRIREMPEVRR